MPENTRAGQNVGSAVEATDADRGNRLTYSLEGPGKDSFTITSTGQIRTKSGATYDYESRQGYSVTVKVDDGQRKDNSVATKSVTINVEDRDEPPSTPSAPRVMAMAGSTDSVRVTWDEPNNTGPPINDYDVQCLNCPARVSHDGVDRNMIITGLTPGTRYNVQIRAWNAEGHSDWSGSGAGSPNADVANQEPIFSGGARTFDVEENSVVAGDPIGSPVTAVDPDLDTVTHTLEGTDATSFSIDAGSGQIRATGELNHEEKSRYSVTVKATDTRGGSATVGVTINVTDVNEPPARPEAPTVTPASSTSILVSWDAPENTGPSITDYDYRYREALGSWTEVSNTTITATAVVIPGLTPGTSYDVDVRATNAEGTSDWSNSGIGSTTARGANSPPVFTEGTSATRSVSATAPAGTLIGAPVTATDADAGATLTYSLEGNDAASFNINSSTGQLLTRSGVTLTAGTTYTVRVVADDGTDRAEISVTINATAAPPNNPPVFTEGASAARSVSASAPAGTSIGAPLTATDADAGATLAYSLEGADAASFGINPANGQLLTVAGVTLDRSTYIVDVVASDGSATSRITVTITVTPNRAPVFSEGGTATRSVREDAASGTAIGSPVTATDADPGARLTYRVEGTDAGSFTINTANGQLLTSAALDADTKATYTVDVVASDGSLEARITVTITVTATNMAPVFSEGASTTRTVSENAQASSPVGAPVTATDADNDTLVYSLDGTDASSFDITSSGGQLLVGAGTVLDASTKSTYSVTVVANDGSLDARITVTITVTPTNRAPVFSEGGTATRSVREDAASGTAIGSPVTATDADPGARLTYRVEGTDAGSFTINTANGQLLTSAALDADTKATYTVDVVASDGSLEARITVTITVTATNMAPVFSEGASTTRTVSENAQASSPVGAPVTATDADNDTLVYSLDGTDASSFDITSSGGQLLVGAGTVLDASTKSTYSVTVVANDGSLDARITVTITVTPTNRAPVFSEGGTATRSVREDAASGTAIGSPVTATDADPGARLTYRVEGTDAGSFTINTANGQLLTSAALDADTKATYTVDVVASDGSLEARITVTITVTATNMAPVFSEGASTTRTVSENAQASSPVGAPVTATDADNDTLVYSLDGTDASSFDITSSGGQLLVGAGTVLDASTKSTYSVTVVANDGSLDARITVTITVTPTNRAPVFSEGGTATRSVREDAASGTAIGSPVTATDADPGARLTYRVEGTDAGSFTINTANGQLLTSAALDADTKATYTVDVVASDGSARGQDYGDHHGDRLADIVRLRDQRGSVRRIEHRPGVRLRGLVGREGRAGRFG